VGVSEQRRVEFFKLSRAIQDRFVGSAGNVFAPVPLIFAHVTPKAPLFWAGGSLASLVTLVLVMMLGYGNLNSGLSSHGGVAAVLYILLVSGVVGCAVRAVHLRKRIAQLPYRPGIYVFPMCLVDARAEKFDVVDMTTLAVGNVLPGAPPKVFLSFQGGEKYEFPVVDNAAGEAALTSITNTREEVKGALERNDGGELVTLDPLHQPRFSSPVAPRDAYVAYAPKWAKFFFAIGLGAGVVVGPILWLSRNAASDSKMYKTAAKANDVTSYKEYLAHGKSHADEVTDTLLPRAELLEAQQPGTPEALLAYIDAHPNSKIKPEVDEALRQALLVSLDKAKQSGTLASLTDFAKKYQAQRPLVQKELAAAMHDVYARELAAYKAKAPTKDKAVVPFIERLFAWAEAHGSNVEIKTRRKPSSNLDKADAWVTKQPNFMGTISFPSKYFDAAHSQKRESALAKDFVDRLSKAFSPELIAFKAAGDGPDASQPTPAFTVPTLLITHQDEWSTLTWDSKLPRGEFVGINYNFEAEFFIPGDAKTYKWKLMVAKGAQGALNTVKDEPGEGSTEERVYEIISKDAFGQFADKYLATIVPAEKKGDK
jgi:hypothetical protein